MIDGGDSYKRMLIDGVAMVEIAHDQALRGAPAWERDRQHTGILHLAKRLGGVRLGKNGAPGGPEGEGCRRQCG